MKILIDIGHAAGTGAYGNGLEEHTQGARIAAHLARLLEEAGWEVEQMDWAAESNSSDLNKAIAHGAASDADVLVSIHCDCTDNAAAYGGHVCYYSKAGKELAIAVCAPLCQLLPGRAQRTVRRTLPILRKTAPIAILCECGFLSNPQDAHMIRLYPERIAQSIATGLLYYQESK